MVCGKITKKNINMKQLIPLFLFLLPCLAWAQYPSNGNQKITLGEQTTADGLIFRGVASDTTLTVKSDTAAYFVLDTVNINLYTYKASATGRKWRQVETDSGSIAYVNTYGLQTINGVKTFTDTIIVNKGIRFPATQSLSTNANTLDDYEEGTFTPILEGQISNPTVTYTSQIATYNKIGRLVTFEILLRANRTAGGSGRIRIAGLPFTCAEVYGYAATVGNSNIPTTLPFVGNVINSAAFILFYTNTFAVTEVSNWCSDCYIYCSGYYHTN
jgi:hypothetical protein